MAQPFRSLFSLRWLLTTLLVIMAVVVLARLGIWQLDRLEKRKAFNARVIANLHPTSTRSHVDFITTPQTTRIGTKRRTTYELHYPVVHICRLISLWVPILYPTSDEARIKELS